MKVRMQTAMLPKDAFTASVNLGGLRLMSPLVGSQDPDRWTALDRSIVMPGARVSPGVRLTNVIVAPNTVIPHGLHIGDDPEEDARWFRVSGDTTLVNSAMLARRGALRTSSVFSLFQGGPSLHRKAQRVQ
jgi:glucose-1-phosphate adenylyltransferase